MKDFDLFAGYMAYMGTHQKKLAEEEPERISGLFTFAEKLYLAEKSRLKKFEFPNVRGSKRKQ